MAQLKGNDAWLKTVDLCKREGYFTCGSQRQYDKFLSCVEKGIWLETLARMLWLCCDEKFDYNDVYKKLYYTLIVDNKVESKEGV